MLDAFCGPSQDSHFLTVMRRPGILHVMPHEATYNDTTIGARVRSNRSSNAQHSTEETTKSQARPLRATRLCQGRMRLGDICW